MTEVFSSGEWKAKDGEEQEFESAWTEFAKWASEMPGAGPLQLTRDLAEEGHYLSFAPRESLEAMRNWKSSPDFKQRMGRVREHVTEFSPAEYELVAKIEKGAAAQV
jgi:heme-degrading monooxygenase HmoA